MRHVVIYGGSFNPPTLAHVGVVRSFIEGGIRFDAVLVAPTFEHAYGKKLAPFEERMRMCQYAFQGLHNVHVSALDKVIVSEPRGSMYSTYSQLVSIFPGTRVSVIVGQDQAEEIDTKWYRGRDLVGAVSVLVVPRADAPIDFSKCPWLNQTLMLPQLAPELRNVSSTSARTALRNNDSVLICANLQKDVAVICKERGLYHD